jgi:PKD repeat protein
MLAIVVSFGLIAGAVPGVLAVGPELPLPSNMAAVGDSITQAASSAGSLGADAPQNSWSTGTSTTVNSHYLRLLDLGAPINGANHNRSVSGAKVADLTAQMADAASLTPDYLTVLIGGNDLCTDTVTEMTSVTDFHDRFQAAMTMLNNSSPDTWVYVVSIPNVYQLWQLFKDDFWARFVWSSADICQSLLSRPTSTQQDDVNRRAAVHQRNVGFNAQLAEVCSQFDHCLFDNNAVFDTSFTRGDVSGDYFHPSLAGQAKLAAVSWSAGFTWTATPPPPPENQPPSAAFTPSCTGLSCSFADGSTDDAPLVGWSWTFGDDGRASAANPSHDYATAGTYAVTLTVTDAEGLTDTTSQSVTVAEAASEAKVYVESIGATSESTGRNSWIAIATITVVDTNGRLVDGATASGSWTAGGSDSCVTGATSPGQCTLTSDRLNNRKVDSTTLTITAVADELAWDETQGVTSSGAVARP